MTPGYTFREAADSDIPAILYIRNVCLPESKQVSLENRKEWLQSAREMGFPVIVASSVATGELVAHGSLGFYQPFTALRLYVPCSQVVKYRFSDTTIDPRRSRSMSIPTTTGAGSAV